MTFEEFFIKKRIDLALLQRAKPDLYEEFRQHYAQMGEKSFDHTKKYWFNQLRKTFLLPMAEIPIPKPRAAPAAASNEPVATVSEAAKPTGLSSMSPPGFKPRFKASAIKAAPDPKASPEKSPEETPLTAKPVGFKPRFKAAVTAPAKADGDSDKPAAEAKPLGFKPRFKAGVTDTPQPATGTKPHDQPSTTDNETANQDPEDKHAAPEKPLGFKPRFKPGITGANKGKSG